MAQAVPVSRVSTLPGAAIGDCVEPIYTKPR
jgi:hypothetical protein